MCWGDAKRYCKCPHPVNTHRGFASPHLLCKLLHSLHLLSPVLAGQVLGIQCPPTPPVPLLQERSGCQLGPLPHPGTGALSRDLPAPLQDISSRGGEDPYLPQLPAPLCPSSAPDVRAVGHVSRMVQCQAGWLPIWHKPRELSSHCCCAAKHQAFSITAPKPICSFR